MKESLKILRKYRYAYLSVGGLVTVGVLSFIILSHRGENPKEASLVIKGKVFEIIEVTSNKAIARLNVSESSVDYYDVREEEHSWCCVVKGGLAEIPMYPYTVEVGDSLEYGPQNRIRLFRSGEKIYDEKLGTSPLGGVFEKVREKHKL